MMTREHYVYQLRVEDESLPFYIGKGKGNRAWDHFKESDLKNSGNTHKTNKIRKAHRLGKHILVEYLQENVTDKQAQRLEKFWISKIGRADLRLGPLTNLTDGGDGLSGRIMSDESKAKMSKTRKGRKQDKDHIDKRIAKTAETRRGTSWGNHSDDTKARMSHSIKESLAKIERHPWEHPRTIKIDGALFLWSIADKMYDRFLLGEKDMKIASSLSIQWTNTMIAIVRNFKKGWIPANDDKWLNFKRKYECTD